VTTDRPPVDGTSRRRQVIAAAIRVFADKGVERASVLEIAALADVPRATIYDDFGSKEGLIAVAMEHIAREISLVDETARAREPTRESLVEQIAAVFRWVEVHPSEAWLFYLWSRGAGPQVELVRRDLVERHTNHRRASGRGLGRHLANRVAVQTSVATVTAWLSEDYFPPGTALEDLVLPQARVQSCLDGRPEPPAPMPLDERARALSVDERVSLVLRILRGESASTLALRAGMDADILRRWVHHFVEGGRASLVAEQPTTERRARASGQKKTPAPARRLTNSRI
jgi:AcrR family transcriptional regulator